INKKIFYLFSPVTSQQLSSSSNSDSDSENDLISIKKTKSKSVDISTQPIIIQTETIKTKDVVKNEIDAIVTSCFTTTNKEVKRKIKLGKRTAADDQEYENEDEYLTYCLDQSRNRSRNRNISRMSISPPEAPPYPTTPEDNHENDETSTSAYAEIL
ncbi:unnamed protein product, partial [Rotaria sp. Silwood1]